MGSPCPAMASSPRYSSASSSFVLQPFICISSSSKKQSFTVSHLKKKCGLSSESALTAAKYVQFATSDRADTVIAFFKNHGFSEPQITRLIKGRPVVLLYDVEKTLSPKLEFLRSKAIFGSSLEKQIVPSFNGLSNLLKSDEKIIHAVKRYPRHVCYDLNAILLPNIDLLLDNGVPECSIVTTLHSLPSTLMRSPIQFKNMVEETKEMGFIPSRPMFMVALCAMSSMSKSTWKKKFEVFKKFGWSEKEALEAFRRYPMFIKLGGSFLKTPYALGPFMKSTHLFIEKFVNRFKVEVSELLKLYQEKLNLSKNWKIG
ncbi:PREDICTED: uncharacterized protein LOC18594132 [Theobroma cacao]|uniref:Uncharacterized protein LOC18594132 n=1 Tax=Theobroma cacao TaxID=3641 RepID=A0AB32WM29_THECC|nr:PREDICTED: uncharacterized protein LOC18594132 [Theobroma cacao]